MARLLRFPVPPMNVLSIQSAVAYGHVGNAAAQPALHCLGHTVWRVDTVTFSNHPGHGKFAGQVRPAAEVAAVLQGLADLGVQDQCGAILSGYLGEAATAEAIAKTVTQVKRANPQSVYLLDPVMGDAGRVYVRDGVPDAMAKMLLPLADMIAPNAFELSLLADQPVTDKDSAVAAARRLIARGPSLVLATGLRLEGGKVATLAVTEAEAHAVTAPWLDRPVFGTGDLFGALFLGHWLEAPGDAVRALRLAASGMAEAIAATEAAGSLERALIPNLERICHPPALLPAERV
ncbi:pyridoxal kinase [Oceanibaculum indicum]|uniref:pyridoxal kinase n=1 Tax=Oceanibaculum indicum TaxID=526216 RepID=UPI0012EAE2D9|nr:pyridoxal kinase [Oceanibaculum indicum]